MPKRKRSRKHRKHHNSRNHFSSSTALNNDNQEYLEDYQLRDYSEDTSLNLSTPIHHAERLNLKTDFKTPSPKAISMDLRSRAGSYISDLKRQEESLNYSELKYLFNCSYGHPSGSNLKQNNSDRSNSSTSKLQSLDLIANIDMPSIKQKTEELPITETPHLNHDELLEFDYEIEQVSTPISGYKTPLKRMRPDNISPAFDIKDSAVRIQDLNNLRSEKTEEHKIQNCSRVFNSDSLKRLQNFNELILNTSQSVNYDNCEKADEVQVLGENVCNNQDVIEVNSAELSGTEISFFTPQLYNGKSASTPIAKSNKEKSVSVERNKIEIIKSKTNISASAQIHKVTQHHIGVQTNVEPTQSLSTKIKNKDKIVTIVKRRSYKSLPPMIVSYKTYPKLQSRSWQVVRTTSSHRVSLERSERINSITAIETCTRILSKIKKYHRKYSSKLPEKIIDLCTWLGITIRKGVASLYKLYMQQKSLEVPNRNNITTCNSCHNYLTQISVLTASIENLHAEISNMKHQNNHETSSLLHSELQQIRRELHQFDDIKKELHNIKEQLASHPTLPMCGVPVPPPPPPPPTFMTILPSITSTKQKTVKVQQTKKNENSRPVISLDDILKVKLRKTRDRPSPARRATEPLVSSSFKSKLKPTSRPQTPSSTASPSSSMSNSPRSSLTRILTNVDTNVCRVKRLQRQNAYSFDDFSRRNLLLRRERENS